MKKKGKPYIGTSGWSYSHWEDIFYPRDLSSNKRLEYFSRHFNTVEINYSFYHLPSEKAFLRWYSQTSDNFIFSVKLNRFITHIKRLKGVKSALNTFLERAMSLKDKLGPILVQFPPNFSRTRENQSRLKRFFTYVDTFERKKSSHFKLRLALEFRHVSWFNPEGYKTLRKFKAALVLSDSSVFPKADILTADFVYIRMHGPSSLFSSDYSKQSLQELAHKIMKRTQQGIDVYCYFNNDFSGFAVKDAQYLSHLLKSYENKFRRPH